jgi:DNA invertase Pin-like site-specific DNA recombinase
VAYLRVSTEKQGRSGLGLEAQRAACQAFIAAAPGASLLREYVEVESGKRNARPALAKAMAEARAYGATLLIAKLDRLSRDAHFLIGLSRSDLDFVAADNPHANKLTVGIMALIAEQEREAISSRTIAALRAAKERGTKLGNPNGAKHLKGRGNAEAVATVRNNAEAFAARVLPIIAELEAQSGGSANAVAKEMNARGIPTARGGAWTARAVLNAKTRATV